MDLWLQYPRREVSRIEKKALKKREAARGAKE